MSLTIKTKLFTGFIILLLLLSAVAWLSTNKLSESNERLGNLVDVSSKRINLSNELLIAVLEGARQEKNLILESDPQKMDVYKKRLEQHVAEADEKAVALDSIADSEGKKIIQKFTVTWARYKDTLADIVQLSYKNEDDKAFKLSSTEGLKTRDEVITMIGRLIDKNKQRMAAEKVVSDTDYNAAQNLIVVLVVLSLLIAVALSWWIIQSIGKRISYISKEAEKIAGREFSETTFSDPVNDELKPVFDSLVSINESFKEVTVNAKRVASGDYGEDFVPKSEKDALGIALKTMTRSLRETTAENRKHIWLTTGQNQVNERMRGDQSPTELSNNLVAFLAHYLDAKVGAVYFTSDKDNLLHLTGKYAFSSTRSRDSFQPGEGLVGQAAAGQKILSLSDSADTHLRISSATVDATPRHVLVIPFLFEGKTLGVVELGKQEPFTETEKEFIASAMESAGINVNSAMGRQRIQQLLEETQVQSEELQSQQEELRQVNEELEEQTQNLRQQQEELQMTNEELEEQTQALEAKNREVETARADIEQKTKQLEISSRYKSEFLANMSHELRTPLNSLLILSRDLSENKRKNLVPEQVESAEIIYKSGRDLLVLINEVLDLSKIEAGKMSLDVKRISLSDFITVLHRDFKHQAEEKQLSFEIVKSEHLPEFISTDPQRLDQVMKNLLSNAFKFTEKGGVTIYLQRKDAAQLSITVTDTGIGIPAEKQAAVFEAFQQVDGSTSRKYGGTGLGLSISRELARLLGGRITLTSKENEGSSFTLTIPNELARLPQEMLAEKPSALPKPVDPRSDFLNYPSIPDDREQLKENDQVVLLIEDDLKFAAILLRQANKKGFKCIAAATGEDGLVLAEKYKPHAIILDIDLPGMNGHEVLATLKANPAVRHIPVHIMSVNERSLDPIKEGAVEYLTKPVDKKHLDEAFSRIESLVSRKMKNLLIIEDDDNARRAMKLLIGNGDVKCFEAGTGSEALSIYDSTHIDCIVLDIGLPDMSGFDLIRKLEKMKDGHTPPVIVYTGKELTREENAELQKYAESIIIKGVKSEERLLDETALFLHRTISNLPESKQRIINNLYDKQTFFNDKKVLLVDDDMRNVFALSKILRERGMQIVKAENGVRALEELDKDPQIDAVLMDIMMPEMDGYEAMRRIRAQDRFRRLPILALTAKAMKDDRQKCIDAGANDYITKPVDIERLLTLMRVWMNK